MHSAAREPKASCDKLACSSASANNLNAGQCDDPHDPWDLHLVETLWQQFRTSKRSNKTSKHSNKKSSRSRIRSYTGMRRAD